MKKLLANVFYALGDVALFFDWGATYQWAMRIGDTLEFGSR